MQNVEILMGLISCVLNGLKRMENVEILMGLIT